MGTHADVLQCAVRHSQTTLMFEVFAGRRCAADDFLCSSPILGMYTLHHHFQGWLKGTIKFEDTVGFVRPNNLSVVRFPPEAARVAEFLGFGQINLLTLQFPG